MKYNGSHLRRKHFFALCCTLLLVMVPAQASEPNQQMIGRDVYGGTDATITADGRYIVTSSRRSGSFDLWLLDTATSTWSRLTDSDADEIEPQWSPDGTRIAYVSTQAGTKDVWLLDLHSRETRPLAESENDDEYPAWSPDGSMIVYTTGPWKHRHFMLIDVTSPKPVSRTVNEDAGHVGACSFHPDGSSLLCHTYENGYGDIVHIGFNGQIRKTITEGQNWDYKPAISADGAVVAFTRIMGQSSAIFTKSYRTGELSQITSTLDHDRWPAFFDQDGQQYIFFHRLVSHGSSVVIYDRQTGQQNTIIGARERPLQAAFDPQARRIAYCATSGRQKEIRILDRESGKTRRIEVSSRHACYPRWSPKGDSLAFLSGEGGSWQLSTIELSSGTEQRLTSDTDFPNGINGPIDWSSDGKQIVFAANTAPYESDIFLYDFENGKARNLTSDSWHDEAPAWDGNNSLVFMSTRAGGWTWGLFRMATRGDRAIEPLGPANYVEKNFPRPDHGGILVWSEYRMCDATEYIAIGDASKQPLLLRELPGARWPSTSPDGNEILVTQVRTYVEFWKARTPEITSGQEGSGTFAPP